LNGYAYRPPTSLRDALTGVNHVFLTAHVDPDPDALGSALGLYHVLRRYGWQPTVVCIGRLASFAHELPGWEDVVQFPSEPEEARTRELMLSPGDALVVCDTPTATRMAGFYDVHRQVLSHCKVIVIDHHYTNDQFGTINFVQPTAAASAEVICDLLDDSGMEIDTPAAICLLTALVTDTQSFRTDSTTPHSLHWAERLCAAGAQMYPIARNVFANRTLGTHRLWGAALRTLRAEDGIAWVQLTQKMFAETGSDQEDAEGLVDFLLSSREVKLAVVLRQQQGGETRVSLRTVPGVDATRIAGAFGGGGHQRASGCTIFTDPEEAAEQLIPVARAEVLVSAATT
jgi:phosphoesterase RecJ-like protein